MSFLELHNVTKVYREGHTAVNNVSLSIEEGSIYGLLGPNGAGKSTIINMILGLTPITKGNITILDTPNTHIRKVSSNIGYVPQDIAIYPDLTAYENVALFGSLYGLRGKKLKESVMESLGFVGLTEHARQFPRSFSGGMNRRLNIACALVHSPTLIILDEPTVGIDPQSRNHILESIRTLNERGVTVIYTSHYMEEVEKLCDYIYIMDHGHIIEQGNKVELERKYEHELQQTVIVTCNADTHINAEAYPHWSIRHNEYDTVITIERENVDQIIQELNAQSIQFNEIKRKHLNLEEIFLHLTGKNLRD